MRQLFLFAILISLWLPIVAAANTTITYQGQLQDTEGPFDGSPGMEFRLFDSAQGGTQVGDTEVRSAVTVTNGLFQVDLDFGQGAFDGNERWLEVEVAGQILEPRQRVAPSPVAVHALNVPTNLTIEEITVDRIKVNHTLPRFDEVGDDPERVINALSMLFDETPWAGPIFRSGPAHEVVGPAFFGAALAPNGKVIFAPFYATNVGIYDPATGTYTSGPAHGEGAEAFLGAAVAPTGKVIFAPFGSANVGIYDPATDTYTSGPAHGAGGGAFSGAALAPTGEVIFAPLGSANVGIYDPATDTYTDGPAHGEGDDAFRGAAVAATGEVIFVPHESANVGIYDPATGTYTSGSAHGEGAKAFAGAALAPTGEVIFVPHASANVGIYDPAADTYTTGPAHGEASANAAAFAGAALAPTGEVIFAPYDSANVGVLDTSAQTIKARATALHPLINNGP